MKVTLLSISDPAINTSPINAEALIVYCARVSSPQNQDDLETAPRLLAYLIKHRHWSPFEMVDFAVRIETTRAVSAQLLRHRSFVFQEFSQRYAKVESPPESTPARRQDTSNRQASHDDLPDALKQWWVAQQARLFTDIRETYREALDLGIAKECARMILPLSTTTTLYMKGSVRSWIHYLDARCDPTTQSEHREVARAIHEVFAGLFPETTKALALHGGDVWTQK